MHKSIKEDNNIQYALFKFTKSSYISPYWTLLMLGDTNAWEQLAQNFYSVEKSDDPLSNPFLALVYVLNMRSCPLVVK